MARSPKTDELELEEDELEESELEENEGNDPESEVPVAPKKRGRKPKSESDQGEEPAAPRTPRVLKPLRDMKGVRTAIRAMIKAAGAPEAGMVSRELVTETGVKLTIGATAVEEGIRFSYPEGFTTDQRVFYRYVAVALGFEQEKPATEAEEGDGDDE